MDLWIPLALGVLTLVAAVIGARADRGERQAEARYDAFRRALAERERRDAAESIRSSPDRPE